jgi:hypothetical protein
MTIFFLERDHLRQTQGGEIVVYMRLKKIEKLNEYIYNYIKYYRHVD